LREHITHEHGSESALQECVIVACRILRKYPKKFDTLIKDIIDQMRRIDEPESKSAFIWILGEYSDKIEGAEEKLQFFVDSFSDEATHVCLQILTAAVKMYIRNPDENEEMVMHVLKLASEESDNPDLRDRGYIYWRMLHTDPTRTKEVVLTKRPSYNEDLTNLMDEETREIFISVGIPKFKSKKATEGEVAPEPKQLSDDEEEPEAEGEHVEKEVKPKKEKKRKNKRNKDEEEKKQIDVEEISIPEEKPKSLIDDLFNFDSPEDSSQQPSDLNIDPLAEIFGSSSNGIQDGSSSGLGGLDSGVFGSFETPISSFIKPKPTEVLNSSIVGSSGINKGLQIQGRFYRDASTINLQLNLTNNGSNTLSDFQMMFNKNSFGLTCGTINLIPLSPGQSASTTVECNIDPSNADMKNPPSCPYLIQTALKCSLDVFYFQIPCLLHILLSSTPISVTQVQCQQMASSISVKNSITIVSPRFADCAKDLKNRLSSNSFYHIYDDGAIMVFASSTVNNLPVLVRVSAGGGQVAVEQ
jgi:hypothetical protein